MRIINSNSCQGARDLCISTARRLRTCLLLLTVGLAGCAGNQTSEIEAGYIDDQAVTEKVQDALTEALAARIASVKVQTFKGVVLLSGVVESNNIRRQAMSITRHVNGVDFVKNVIRIR